MTAAVSEAKRASGRRAAEFVESGMTLGLGTGSTVAFALERIAERIQAEGLELSGVPTSIATEKQARALGIPLVSLDDVSAFDLTIDGADEVDPDVRLIKGGGGALLREKVVASLTRRQVIIVGRDKLVERLGRRFPLPVEVVPFARAAVARRLRQEFGAEPRLRRGAAGDPFLTDNGNEILDCSFSAGIDDPARLDPSLNALPGVVENGLFVGLTHVLVIASDDGSVELREVSS